MEYISAIVMIILAFVTYLYLNETKKIRKMYEKTFDYEYSPKVFLREVNSEVQLNTQKRSLEYITLFDLQNSGKSSALNFECNYSFVSGNLEKEAKYEQPAYLHPGQGIKFRSTFLGVLLDDDSYNAAKKLKKENKPLKITDIIPKPQLPPVYLNVTPKYCNQDNTKIEHKYALEHEPNKNIWIYRKEEITNI